MYKSNYQDRLADGLLYVQILHLSFIIGLFEHFPKLHALSYQYAHWNALQGNKLFAKSNFANAGSSSMQNFFLPKFLQQHISSKPNWILSPVPYLGAVERSYVVNLKKSSS